MPDFSVDVAVEPDASRFPEQLAASLSRAEARQGPFKVHIEPEVNPREFAADTQRRVRVALADLDARVNLDPNLARSFRRDVERLAKTALAAAKVEVKVDAVLGARFRSDLNKSVAAATRNANIEIPVQAKLGPGFVAKLRRQVRTALAARPLEADIAMRVDRRSFATFTADLVRRAQVAAGVASQASAIRPDVDTTRFAADLTSEVAEEVAALGRTDLADVTVGADLASFTAGLTEGVTAATRRVSDSDLTDISVGADTAAFDAALIADVGAAIRAISGTEATSVEVTADTGLFAAVLPAEVAAATAAVSASTAAAVAIRADLATRAAQLEADLAVVTGAVAASEAASIEVSSDLTVLASRLRGELAAITRTVEATDAAEITMRADLLVLRSELEAQLAATTAVISASEAASVEVSADVTAMAVELEAQIAAITHAVSLTDAADIDIGVDTGPAVAELVTLDRAVGRTGRGLGGLGKVIGIGAVAGLAGILATAAAAFGVAVAKTAEFEAELSGLQAVSEATTTELGRLREQALQAGADTVFSASEAAQAQTELAKAGVSLTQILGGGLPAALALASAGEIELGEAATFVATGLNVFQLQGEDAARVADTLAAAAAKSAADISDIGPAFAQSALVAKQLGLSLEDTAGSLALFAQQGLKGSDAGTSFRTMLLRLNPSTKEAAAEMNRLGLDFFDAQNNFVGIEAAAGQLQERLKGMGQEQRSAALLTIFGTDAIRAANILYDEGAAGVDKWTKAVSDSGFAADVAATKLDNLKGDVENLRGSLETVFITAGEGSTSGLRSVVQGLKEVVDVAGPGLAAAIAPIGILLQTLAPMLGGFTQVLLPALAGLGRAATPILASLLGLSTDLLSALNPVFAALRPLGDAFSVLVSAVSPLLPILGGFVTALVTGLVPVVRGLAEALAPVVTLLADQFAAVLPQLIPLATRLGEAIGGLLVDLSPVFVDLLQRVFTEMGPLIPDLVTALVDLAASAAELLIAVTPLLPPLTELFVRLVQRPQVIALTLMAQAFTLLADAVTPLVEGVAALLSSGLEEVVDLTERLTELDAGSIVSGLRDVGEALGGGLAAGAEAVVDFVSDLPDILADLPGDAADALADLGPSLVESVGDALAAAGRTALAGVGNVLGFFAALPFRVVGLLAALPGLIAEGVAEVGPKLGDAFVEVFETVTGIVAAGVGDVVGFFAALPFRIVGGLAALAGLVVAKFTDLFGFLRVAVPAGIAAVARFFAELPGRLVSFIADLPGRVGAIFVETFARARLAVAEGVDLVVGLVASLPGRVLGFVGAMVGAGAAVGRAVIDGLRSGFRSAIGIARDIAAGVARAVKDAINSVIDRVNDAIPNSIKISGPLPDINLPDNPIPRLAAGDIITRPTLIVAGEAGDELILPLTNRRRMLELLREAGVIDAPTEVALTAPAVTVSAPLVQVAPPVVAAAPAVNVAVDLDLLLAVLADVGRVLAALPDTAVRVAVPVAASAAVAVRPVVALDGVPDPRLPPLLPRPPERPRVAALAFKGDTAALSKWVDASVGLFGKLEKEIQGFVDRTTFTLAHWAGVRLPEATVDALVLWRDKVRFIAANAANDLGSEFERGVARVADAAAMLAAMPLAGPSTEGTEALGFMRAALTDPDRNMPGFFQSQDGEWLRRNRKGQGEGPVDFPFSFGGVVPGPRVDRDIVPALLMPGEVVIRRASVERFGLEELLSLNRGIAPPGWVLPQRMAEGGVVAPVVAVEAALSPSRGAAGPFRWPTPPDWSGIAERAVLVPVSSEVRHYVESHLVERFRDGGLVAASAARLVTLVSPDGGVLATAPASITTLLHETGEVARIVELARQAPSLPERARDLAAQVTVLAPAQRAGEVNDERPVGDAVQRSLDRFEQRSLAILAAALDQRPLVGSLTVEGRGDGRRDAAAIVRELRAERFRAGL